MTPQEQYEHLVETVKSYNPAAGFDQIRAAYEFAAAHHAGQNRKDGSPFVTHPLAVAQIVAEELHLDTESIVAALLHDTIEDTTATHEEISHLFSPTVADLVEGVSKLTRVHYTSKEEEQMENLRKMLMAMAKDIRVILIKISDRLHNMRTMEYQTPEKQKQKSFETMEIYAPIAHRLGMQKMKWELEDLSLKYLDPVGYREITEALDEKAAESPRAHREKRDGFSALQKDCPHSARFQNRFSSHRISFEGHIRKARKALQKESTSRRHRLSRHTPPPSTFSPRSARQEEYSSPAWERSFRAFLRSPSP